MRRTLKQTKLGHHKFPQLNDFTFETGQGKRFRNVRCQMLPKNRLHFKEFRPLLWGFWKPVSFEDQSADMLSNKNRSTFWFGKTLPSEFRTQWQGDCNVKPYWPSNASFPESHEFEIYKCHTLFSERITVDEMDVFRHQWHLIISLDTKKNRLC